MLNESGGDALLICTGDGFKWYSESVFFDTGTLLEISPATESVHDADHSEKCSLAAFAEQSFAEPTLVSSIAYIRIQFAAEVSEQYQRLSVDKAFSSHAQRAPPSLVS
jgi:hypothetical protein